MTSADLAQPAVDAPALPAEAADLRRVLGALVIDQKHLLTRAWKQALDKGGLSDQEWQRLAAVPISADEANRHDFRIAGEVDRKFLREAATWDIAIFESVAGHVLDTLGYARTVVQPREKFTFSEEEILAFDDENRKRQEEFRKLVDPADLIRRDLQCGLLKTVKERLAQKQAAATTPARLPPVQHDSDTNAGIT